LLALDNVAQQAKLCLVGEIDSSTSICVHLSYYLNRFSFLSSTRHYLNLKLFTITLTELRLIAAAASMGLKKRIPKKREKDACSNWNA
jgi:hypothetical protein